MQIRDPGPRWKKIKIRDPGWKTFGSGTRAKHPGTAILVPNVYKYGTCEAPLHTLIQFQQGQISQYTCASSLPVSGLGGGGEVGGFAALSPHLPLPAGDQVEPA